MYTVATYIVGNFQGRKFSKLSLHDRFCKLIFEDLIDGHNNLYYEKGFKELIFEVAVKFLKTAKFIVSLKISRYKIHIYIYIYI